MKCTPGGLNDLQRPEVPKDEVPENLWFQHRSHDKVKKLKGLEVNNLSTLEYGPT
jgi:hypothetical protein